MPAIRLHSRLPDPLCIPPSPGWVTKRDAPERLALARRVTFQAPSAIFSLVINRRLGRPGRIRGRQGFRRLLSLRARRFVELPRAQYLSKGFVAPMYAGNLTPEPDRHDIKGPQNRSTGSARPLHDYASRSWIVCNFRSFIACPKSNIMSIIVPEIAGRLSFEEIVRLSLLSGLGRSKVASYRRRTVLRTNFADWSAISPIVPGPSRMALDHQMDVLLAQHAVDLHANGLKRVPSVWTPLTRKYSPDERRFAALDQVLSASKAHRRRLTRSKIKPDRTRLNITRRSPRSNTSAARPQRASSNS